MGKCYTEVMLYFCGHYSSQLLVDPRAFSYAQTIMCTMRVCTTVVVVAMIAATKASSCARDFF